MKKKNYFTKKKIILDPDHVTEAIVTDLGNDVTESKILLFSHNFLLIQIQIKKNQTVATVAQVEVTAKHAKKHAAKNENAEMLETKEIIVNLTGIFFLN